MPVIEEFKRSYLKLFEALFDGFRKGRLYALAEDADGNREIVVYEMVRERQAGTR
jgi:hypothetical protein